MSMEQKVIALAQQGMRRGEIAKKAGCNLNSVYCYVYEARKRGVVIPQFRKGSPNWASLMVPRAATIKLRKAAKARGMTPTELAESLLTAMHDGNLIAAVLDDGIADV